MEDTKSLVTVFLQKIFHDRQYLIDTTFKLIYDYNNGDHKKIDYEKTLKSICDQLGKEIPNQVLVYLLTLVDMPLDLAESDDSQLIPVIEKIKTLEEMQKTQNCLTESIKPHLEDLVMITTTNPKIVEEKKPNKTVDVEPSPKPRTRGKKRLLDKHDINNNNNRQIKSFSVESLLDLCADFVIKNHHKLKKTYHTKFDKAWKLILSNQCKGVRLQQCYETLRDLNKKRKLLRDIENDNITVEVVAELYQDIDIFLKEKHMYKIVNRDINEEIMKNSDVKINFK